MPGTCSDEPNHLWQDPPRDIVVPYVGREEADRLNKTPEEVPYKLRSAATIFRMIYRMTASGIAPDEGELCAICELTANALDTRSDQDAFHIEQFGITLRAAIRSTKKRIETLEGKGTESPWP